MHYLSPLYSRPFLFPTATPFLYPIYSSRLQRRHSRLYSASRPPARSPQVRAAARHLKHLPPQFQTSTPSTRSNILDSASNSIPTWPTSQLTQAYTSGAFPLRVNQAVTILQDFAQRLVASRDHGKVGREICSAHSLNPSNLTSLALALLGADNSAYYQTVQSLLLAASALHDPNATITLLRLSHRAGKKAINASVNPALRKELAGLVAAGNPEATDLQAEIEMNEGHTARAIELSEKVVRSDGDEHSKRSAWVRLGNLREEQGDLSGAQAALWVGAQEYDNPRAYLSLAERYMTPDDKNRIPFMQKAAASGEQEAINLLAIEYMQYYLDAKHEGNEQQASSKSLLRLAEEWLLVYVEGPPLKVKSHAYTLLGLLYCERGEVDKGINISSKALQHAVEVGEEDPKVPYSLKWKWEDISDRLTLWVQILVYARESSYRR